jgi:signal transduction histidine kinase
MSVNEPNLSGPIAVLLVEDEPGHEELIRRQLQRGKRRVAIVCVRSLAAALAQLEANAYDVILADLSLPDSQGLKGVKILRAACGAVPIVVLTSLRDELVEDEALDSGAQDYLCKDDATPHALERVIRHSITRQRLLAKMRHMLDALMESRRVQALQQRLLRKKNRRLRQLCNTAQTFVDNVSHEFRTPLTVIKDHVSLVRDGVAGQVTDEQREMLDIAVVRVDDMDAMVNDLLDSSKLATGILSAWRSTCRLNSIVEQVLPALCRKADVKRIQFDVNIPDNLPNIFCDEEKTRRVLINLVGNAMKFCGTPGVVRLDAQLDALAGEVIVRVSDNGHGIASEDLRAIFDRFRQLPAKGQRGTSGFGLGLGIAKDLVELNLGRLEVDSQVGRGSTFSFTIPLDQSTRVLQRYLASVAAGSRNATVTLIECPIDPNSSTGEADCFDTFLNSALRSRDLILRPETHRWLIAAHVPNLEIEPLLERLQEELARINRNRPAGPLPNCDLRVHGSWCAAAQGAELLQCAECLLELSSEKDSDVRLAAPVADMFLRGSEPCHAS